jgi:hypothetical protein
MPLGICGAAGIFLSKLLNLPTLFLVHLPDHYFHRVGGGIRSTPDRTHRPYTSPKSPIDVYACICVFPK